MSTDVSVSEDVSSSGALSHRHANPDGDGGKESETSLVSSEATSASGLAISEDRHRPSQTKGGTVDSRPMDITPACNKIRSLCLSTNEAFEHGRNLPFINPSSLETLRALVQEIQNSGETNPEIWKDCEGRWLHLFQLVEKQYQEQILAQQEQYQCQIQLIQDEIKALVQLQNRQASIQSRTEISPTPVLKTTTSTKDCIFPVLSNDCRAHKNVARENDILAAPTHTLFSSHSLPLQGPDIVNQVGTTGLSSGYGTLSAWGTCLETAGSPREDEDGSQKHHWHSDKQKNTETTVKICQLDDSTERTLRVEESNLMDNQQSTSRTKQTLTSWAQRQKLMAKKSKAEQASSQNPVYKGKPSGHGESVTQNLPKGSDSQEQERPAEPRSSSFPLMRSDSLISQASGLTYWRLNENELYHPLPDSFDSGAYLFLQEASMNLSQSQEPQLSLKEIYENKQRTDSQCSQGEGSVTVSLLSSQVLTLDPSVNQRQSDRTSGFTSPSHFSSPSFTAQPHLYPKVDTPLTPDSMVECSPNPGDTDGVSDASSVSAVRPSPSKGQSTWGNTSHNKTQPCSHTFNQQCRASAPFVSEEEGSHTHTSTLKPRSSSGATLGPAVSPHMEKNSSLEDPVVLSLLRQNLREKHARHVADLKAYYESEIQLLKDKLKLEDLPQDIEKANQALTRRCKYLEKALSEATKCIKELEAGNISLEKKLAEWPERYAVAGATVKSLQQRLEESQCSEKEKEALVARLKSHIRQLEESAQKACREENEKEARMEREYKMLQDLLGEYDSLGKEHERLKKNLVSTENKLFDANDQISELKRVISKLESQVKQLEHENQARARYVSHSNTQPSGAGLFHHPDLLPSPGKGKAEPDVTRKKSPCPPAELQNGDRKSQFLQKNQSNFHKNQSSGIGCSINTSPTGASWSCPSECEQSLAQHRHQELSQRRETSCAMTPMMRALIELEETRATESRAPWVSNQRTTVGFVESRHKEAIHEPTELRKAEREDAKPAEVVVRAERGVKGGAETAAARLRAQRSLSPESYRSSSLPPAHRSIAPTTPTKRKTLIMPLSAKSSPKRCPTENYSTAFGCLMPREEHLLKRFDGQVDQRRHSFHSSSPRKRLHFTSADREDVIRQPESSSNIKPPDRHSQQTWEQGAIPVNGVQISSEDSSPLLLDRLHSLAEAEKLFDELTQEKLQIEAALNRMPRGGGKMSLQTRLDEVALESRLERVNRELGSIRMTLKRFHVLRSTANI